MNTTSTQTFAQRALSMLVLAAFIAAALWGSLPAGSVQAATFTVTKTADTNDGACNSDCSLREAIVAANANGSGSDTIILPAGTYILTRSGHSEDASVTGDLDIIGDLIINGAGEGLTSIDGSNLDRVFHVHSGTVQLNNLTIKNGLAPKGADGSDGVGGNGTAGSPGQDGGCVLNSGTLTLSQVTVKECRAGSGGNAGSGSLNFNGNVGGNGGNGGGIYNTGNLTLDKVTLTSNQAGSGGAGGNGGAGEDGTSGFAGTAGKTGGSGGKGGAGGNGGGLYNSGTVSIVQSSISQNIAGNGGGAGNGGKGGNGGNSTGDAVGGAGGNGGMSGEGGAGGNGGGIYHVGAGLSIERTTVEYNYAGNGGDAGTSGNGGNGGNGSSGRDGGAGGNTGRAMSGGAGGSGGAIYNYPTLVITTVTDCYFNTNKAGAGGNGGNQGTGGNGGRGGDILVGTNPGGKGGAGGSATETAGAGGQGGSGGAIGHQNGTLNINGSTFFQNLSGAGGNGGKGATGGAGGNGGDASTPGNGGNGGAGKNGASAGLAGWGGAIYSDLTTTITMTNSTLSANSTATGGIGGAGGHGGAGGNGGYAGMSIIRGAGGNGGNGGNGGTGTSGGDGGGLYSRGNTSLNFVTLADHSVDVGKSGGAAGTGGAGGSGMPAGMTGLSGTVGISGNSGIGSAIVQASSTFLLKNSIMANNVAPHCSGMITSQDYNLFYEGSSGSSDPCTISGSSTHNITGSNPLLGPLQNNGGPTFTHDVGSSSPARNYIPNGTNDCGTTILTDQRGVLRPGNNACEIGSFEVLDTSVYKVSLSSATYSINEAGGSIGITVNLNAPSLVSVSVSYATSNGTATAGSDYNATSGTLTFAPGETSKTFGVSINNDTVYEGNEAFNVTLSSPSGSTLGTPSTAVVTITDNDAAPVIVLSSATYSVSEAGPTVTIQANISGARQNNATVQYATSNGTATAGSDYTAASGTLTFTPSDTSKTFTVSITNDTVYEGNETFNVTLSSPSGATLGSPASAVITITDNDTAPVISFSSATYERDEDFFTVTITVNISGARQNNASVQYATSNGTATAGSDYTAASGTLTFAPSDTSKTFSVSLLNDTLYEGPETFNVSLSSPSGATLGTPSTAVVTIVDDEPVPVIVLSSATYSVGEAGPTVTIQANISGARQNNATVQYATSNGTATAGSDYTAASGTLTFAPSDTSKTFTVSITNDTVYEGDETFNVTLSSPSGAMLGTPSTAVVTITDNDAAPVIVLSSATYSVSEAGPTVTIQANISGARQNNATVQYATSNGTATAGSDYTAASGTLTFTPSDTSKTFTVSITNDTVYEGNETFNVTLSSPSGATLGSPASAVITITDNDTAPVISFSSATYERDEDLFTVTITVNISGARQNNASVQYATSNGTATAGSDYTAASGTLTFAPSDTSKTFSVSLLNDTLYEGPETFNVSLSSPSGATLGTPSTAVVTIVDDEPVPVIVLSSATYSVGEAGPTVTIQANISGARQNNATVQYATSNGTATAGSDYTAASGTLTFAPSDTSKTFTVSITNDTVYEGDETFNVTLSSPSGAMLGTPSTAVVTITDNDAAPVIVLSSATYSVSEAGPTVTIQANISGARQNNATVQYATSNGTATAGSDYTAASGTLTFTPSDTSKTFTVSITNDTVYEGNETFNVTLSSPSGATLGSPASAVITITDNDTAPVISFSSATYERDEDLFTVTITVNISGARQNNASVQYATSNGTATAGSDYTAASGTLTFAPSDTSKTFSVSLLNDTLYEGPETFNVSLSSPSGATLGTPSTAVVTIVDDEPVPVIVLSSATYSVGEAGPTVTIQANISGARQNNATVQYATSNGTATAGSDYTAASGTLTFAPSDTSKTFTVSITNDTVYEGNETFNVTLSSPSGAMLGTPSTAVVTITDNDAAPVISLLEDWYEVNEGDGTVSIAVRITGSRQNNATVQYATSNGTAAAGSDYTAASGTLTFTPTDSIKYIDVLIIDDSDLEPMEYFTLSLSNPVGATLNTPDPVQVNIEDNDANVDLSIVKTVSQNPVAGGATVIFTLTITNNGLSEAQSVIMRDVLQGFIYQTAYGEGWTCGTTMPDVVICELPALASGETSVITIVTFAPSEAQSATNTATVESNVDDANPSDNTSTIPVTITAPGAGGTPQADLAIEKAGPATVEYGATLAYTLTVTNHGPDEAENLVVTDNLIGPLMYQAAFGEGWSCEFHDQGNDTAAVICQMASLPAGESSEITLMVRMLNTGQTYNSASVSSETSDPDVTNNYTEDFVYVDIVHGTQQADLSVTKSAAPSPVQIGQTLTYTLTVTNTGPDAAQNVVLTDILPENVIFQSASGAGWTCENISGVVVCTLPSLAKDASAEVAILVIPTMEGELENSAVVSSQIEDPDPSDNEPPAPVETPVDPVTPGTGADLSIAKSAAPSPVQIGQTLTYTLTVTNAGPDMAEDVVVVDNLPADVIFQSAQGDGWSCSYENGMITCSMAEMPLGTYTITILVIPTAEGDLANSATVSSSTPDPDPSDNEPPAPVETPVDPVSPGTGADLSITKSAAPSPVQIGQTLTYTLTVTNAGPDMAEDVVVVDNLPADVIFQSAQGDGWSCSYENGMITCSMAEMPLGTYTITILVIPTAEGDLANSATVSSSTPDPDPSDNEPPAPVETPVDPVTPGTGADLSITKSAAPSPVQIGQTLTYTLTVTNAGPDMAEDVVVVDNLPADVIFQSAQGDGWSCSYENGIVTCLMAEMPLGTYTITILVIPTAEGDLANSATVSSSTPDPDPSDNEPPAPVETPVDPVTPGTGADLSITKSAAPSPVQIGQTLTYTLTVTNAGPDMAEDVVVVDNLPADVIFQSAQGDGWSCSYENGIVTCLMAEMPLGTYTITILVIPTAEGDLANSATVSSSTPDPDPSDNEPPAPIETPVDPVTPGTGADLSITKSADPTTVAAGATLTYTITVANAGPDAAEDVVVSDQLPAGMIFQTAYGTGWNCVEMNGLVTCTLASLPAGTSSEITIIVIAPEVPGQVANSVVVSSNTPDPDPADNELPEPVETPVEEPVNGGADLSVTKTADVETIEAGETLTYTIMVSNAGPETALDVLVVDNLPAGVTFLSAAGDGWTCDNIELTVMCTRPSMPVGEAPVITLQVVAPAEPCELVNSVTVSASNGDPDTNDNEPGIPVVTPVVEPSARADLEITKLADPDPVQINGTLTYTLTITNHGPDAALNLVVVDNLPAEVTFQSATGAGWSCADNLGVVTCSLASLDAEATAEVNIIVTAPAEIGEIVNTASVSSDTIDPEAGNNQASITTNVIYTPQADLEVAKVGNPNPVNTGATLTYTLTITNHGPDAASNVRVVDTLPAGVVFQSAIGAGWTCVENAGVVTCDLATLANGASSEIVIIVTAPLQPGEISNTAVVSSDTDDPFLTNNEANIATMVELYRVFFPFIVRQ